VLDQRTGLVAVEPRHHDVTNTTSGWWSAIFESASNPSTAVKTRKLAGEQRLAVRRIVLFR
jgi:hypothetical protein